MNELLEYIEKLKNEPFVGWTEDSINGYLTALGSIEAKIKEILIKAQGKIV